MGTLAVVSGAQRMLETQLAGNPQSCLSLPNFAVKQKRKFQIIKTLHLFCYPLYSRARGGVVVKALRYKPEGREFDSRWCHWNFSLT